MNKPLSFVSWAVAAYFGIGFVAKAGIPPRSDLLIGDALFVTLTLFFLFLPFFNKIKVGSWLELEREVEAAKKEAADATEELREFKNEVRTTLISTNSNLQRMNVWVGSTPGAPVLREQQEAVAKNFPESQKSTADQYVETVRAQEEDPAYSLARVRIDIERLLREKLKKRIGPVPKNDLRLATIRQLFVQLTEQDPSWVMLRGAFDSVLKVCNAAIHGQIIDADQADEALLLGAQIIAALKEDSAA